MIRIQKANQIEPAARQIIAALPVIGFVGEYVSHYDGIIKNIIGESVRKLRRRGSVSADGLVSDNGFEIDGKNYRETARSDNLYHDINTGEARGLNLVIEVWEVPNYTNNDTTERQRIRINFDRRQGAIEVQYEAEHVFSSIAVLPESVLQGYHDRPLRDFADTMMTTKSRLGEMVIVDHKQNHSGKVAALHSLTLELKQAA